MKKHVICLVLLIISFGMITAPLANEKTAFIEKITFSKGVSGIEAVHIKLNGTYSPKTFALKGEKPRFVFDFFDVAMGAALPNAINVEGTLIQRIRIGLHKGSEPKTRVVLDLAKELELQHNESFQAEDQTLVITVSKVEEIPATAKEPQVPQAAETSKPEPQPETKQEAQTAPKPEPVPEPQEEKNPVKEQTKKQEPVAEKTPEPEILKPSVPITKEVEATPPPPPVTAPQATKVKEAVEPAVVKPPVVAPIIPPVTTKTVKRANDEPPTLLSVKFDTSSNRGEMVLFKLNDFYPPIVSGVEEGLPRAICDFKKTELAPSVKSLTETNGRWVKKIRVGKHSDPDRIRVVLDLEPNNNYDLQQVFFKEDNLFVIIVNTIQQKNSKKKTSESATKPVQQ